MQPLKNQLRKLPWDSDFFGFGVGKAELEHIGGSELQQLKSLAQKVGWKVVYLLVDPEDTQSKENAEALGAVLYDEKITFVREVSNEPVPSEQIQNYQAELPASPLFSLALQSGGYSRFLVDKQFKNQEFERLYQAWIENSVKRSLAKEVLVYQEREGEYLGLITLGIKNEKLDIGLLAVDQQSRGKDIGRKLVDAAIYYANLWQCKGMQVVTQGANETACRFYEKQGFKPGEVQQIFHLWL